MKILVISGAFPKPNESTDGNYVYAQLEAMKREGTDIEVISPVMYFPKFLEKRVSRIKKYSNTKGLSEYNGIKVNYPKMFIYYCTSSLWYKYPKLFSSIYKLSIFKVVKKKIKQNRYDSIYCIGSVLEAGLVKRIKSYVDIPIVYIEHSSCAVKQLERKKYKKFYEQLINSCNSIIFVTKIQRDNAMRRLQLKNKDIVINNGYSNDGVNIDSKLDIKKDENSVIILITVGSMIERKGYEYSLRALSEIKKKGYKFKYYIIGEGKMKNVYMDLAVLLGLQEDVVFYGKVSHEEIIKKMYSSDIFILPSWDESFGIVYLEAMSCSVPIIGTKGEGISDIVEDGVNGILVNKKDIDDIVLAITGLINNKELRIKIGRQGYNTAVNFNWDANARKTLDLFEKVINESRG